jgi:hypothetical protein
LKGHILKHAVISVSQIARYGRMDAGFHIAVHSVAKEAAALEAAGEASKLIAQLAALQTSDLALVLGDLVTGSASRPGRAQLDKAIKDYPYVAYALVVKERARLIEAAQERLAEHQQYMQALEQLSGPTESAGGTS